MTGLINNPHIVTLFGGTGDLTYRKLLPAFLNLHMRQELDDNFHIVVIGRRDFTDESYKENLLPWLNQHARFKPDEHALSAFLDRIRYFKMVFTEDEGYGRLRDYFNTLDPHNTCKNLYYFAVDPSYFVEIAQKLATHNLSSNSSVIIEKPFGNDLVSAQSINETLQTIFSEEHIYRIDHYLGKEVVLNILPLRTHQRVLDKWNAKYIKSIEISIFEEVGVESRGGFYDVTGALKDMVHSHLLQVLSLLILDDSDINTPHKLHLAQSKALEALYVKDPLKDIIYGQYEGYRQEPNVSEHSKTDTYVALKLLSKDALWHNVPFYLQTGKKLDQRKGIVIVNFRNGEKVVLELQPNENMKLVLSNDAVITLKTQDICGVFDTSYPEAYERLLRDASRQDPTLFISYNQVHISWTLIEQIVDQSRTNEIYPYPPGSSGPVEKHTLTHDDTWYL